MSNILSAVYPELVSEWSEKNLPLTPDKITYGSNKLMWWKCKKCGDEWHMLISTRSGGSKCPYCSGQILLKGFNDFATTHSQLAEEWSNLVLCQEKVQIKCVQFPCLTR